MLATHRTRQGPPIYMTSIQKNASLDYDMGTGLTHELQSVYVQVRIRHIFKQIWGGRVEVAAIKLTRSK